MVKTLKPTNTRQRKKNIYSKVDPKGLEGPAHKVRLNFNATSAREPSIRREFSKYMWKSMTKMEIGIVEIWNAASKP